MPFIRVLSFFSKIFMFISSAFLFFSLFFIVGFGGTARSGRIIGDEYYLGSHGKFIKVTEYIYKSSLLNEKIFLLSIVFIIFFGLISNLIDRFFDK